MSISIKQTIGLCALVLAVALATGGCKSAPKPVPWNVSITKTTPASIEVDLVGVTESEKHFIDGLSMDSYWPNSPVRRDAEKNMMTKILKTNEPWLITRDDPHWEKWTKRGVTTLYVVANLPVPNGLWKVALPLDKKSWDAKNHTLEIEIQNTLIRVNTPENARN
ncbi:MAG TPA: hypothetical protein VH597_03855 [Verrucomicrobiae bacterium]|nr:hypothetical protein [Verrucomicrobiae bacterium]